MSERRKLYFDIGLGLLWGIFWTLSALLTLAGTVAADRAGQRQLKLDLHTAAKCEQVRAQSQK